MITTVDARRLLCPMPVIRLQDAITAIPVGDQIEMICTDPGVKNDIPAWCRINGHQLETIDETTDDIIVRVRKLHAD